MLFVPNYKTADGYFEIMLDKATLENKPLEKGTYSEWYHNKEITQCKISVYNTQTKKLSEKSIYYNEQKGFYFKGNNSYCSKSPKRIYYIEELVEIKNRHFN